MTAAQIPAGVPRALDGLLPGTPQGRPQPPTGLHLGPVLAVTGIWGISQQTRSSPCLQKTENQFKKIQVLH